MPGESLRFAHALQAHIGTDLSNRCCVFNQQPQLRSSCSLLSHPPPSACRVEKTAMCLPIYDSCLRYFLEDTSIYM